MPAYKESGAITSMAHADGYVEIPADVVARETNTILEKYQKLARLPGFRRGRVPASIIRQRSVTCSFSLCGVR